MTNFDFLHFFGNSNNSTSKKRTKKQRHGRTCRIEELESREMLSVTPWSRAGDVALTEPQVERYSAELAGNPEVVLRYTSGSFNVSPSPALAPLGDTASDQAWLDNFLAATGVSDVAKWENDRIVELNVPFGVLGDTLTLDVSALTALKRLWCTDNQLTELNVNGLTALERLWCADNQLRELNVTGLTALEWLSCESNQLTALNVNGLTNLTDLGCSYNNLAELNVSGLANLIYLNCSGNQLTELNLFGTPFDDFELAWKESWWEDTWRYAYPSDAFLYVDKTVTLLSNPDTPVITTQPQSANYKQHDTATALSVVAAVTGTPTYQWYKDGEKITTGGTSATYTPSTVTIGSATYYCIVTNTLPDTTTVSRTSATARITIDTPPPGNTISTATPVSFTDKTFLTTAYIGEGAHGNKDVHMFAVTVTVEDVAKELPLTFTTSRPAGAAQFSTYIRLFDASGMELDYSNNFGGSVYSSLTFVPSKAGTYFLGVSSSDNRYYYPNVAGSGAAGSTGNYTLTITKGETLPSPQNIQAYGVGNDSIAVSWRSVNNASGYKIEYSTNENFSGSTTLSVTVPGDGNTTSYVIRGLMAGTQYHVRVIAVGGDDYFDSPYSDRANATPNGQEIPNIIVTTLDDVVDAYDGLISLREAIFYAGTYDLGATITFAESLHGETITLHGTQLSIDKNVTIDADGANISINAGRQSRVFYIEGIGYDVTVTLVGLTITGGYTEWREPDPNVPVDPNVAWTGGMGGAIFIDGCSLNIISCVFVENMAQGVEAWGGAIYASHADINIRSSMFEKNLVKSTLQGIRADEYGAKHKDSDDIYFGTCGGGAINADYSTLYIINSHVQGNTVEGVNPWGGGILAWYSTSTLINTVLVGNDAKVVGAGDKKAPSLGGGMAQKMGIATLINVTIAGNQAKQGSGYYVDGFDADAWEEMWEDSEWYPGVRRDWDRREDGPLPSKPAKTPSTASGNARTVFYNSIAARNYGGKDFHTAKGSSLTATNSIRGGDPKFVKDPGAIGSGDYGDLRLTTASKKALNKGNNGFVPKEITTDIAGNARFQGSFVDIGAYESSEGTPLGLVKPGNLRAVTQVALPFPARNCSFSLF